MLKGIYSAAAGMTSELLRNDVIAENLANVSTPGFKSQVPSFQTFGETLINQIHGNTATPLGTVNHGSQVFQTATYFKQGDMMQTGNPLDVAINGEGFFTIKQAGTGNIYYTRAGNFTRDMDGYLTTLNGDRVQGESGDLAIPKQASRIQISRAGQISGDNQVIGQIKVAQFADQNALERQGANSYTSTAKPIVGGNVNIEQGTLEQSNANVVMEMVNSISAMRSYETMQKTIQMQNQTLERVINDVGRVG